MPTSPLRSSLFRIAVLAAAFPTALSAGLQEQIDAAPDGATVQVPAGVNRGPLVIDHPLRLEGSGAAIVDGGGQGTVITITAPDVTLRGLIVRNSGISPDQEDAGIAMSAPRIRIEDCRLEDVLFGIFATQATDSVIRNNEILGKRLSLGRRGDGIRLWESDRSRVENNSVTGTRDTIIWYSNQVVLESNHLFDNRYGLHFMYSNACTAEDNRIEDNSVGIYLMYSRDLVLRHNRITGNRGPSGFGIGLKDVDGVTAERNIFADNRVGIHLDNSPSRADIRHRFADNVIAYNEIGLAWLPSVAGNDFSGNAFIENIEQVAVLGSGGSATSNSFTSADGRGNFWSDYRGFDRDHDGTGDLPYRARGRFEDLMDRKPLLRLFLLSPAQKAVDLASRAFPVSPPRLKAEDTRPQMNAVRIPFETATASAVPRLLLSASGAFLAAGAGVLIFAGRMLTAPGSSEPGAPHSDALH